MDINQTVIDQPLFLIFKMKDLVMVFTTEEFFEAAIESWPEWDWNPQPLKSVQLMSYQAMSLTLTQSQLCIRLLVQCSRFISAIAFIIRRFCFK